MASDLSKVRLVLLFIYRLAKFQLPAENSSTSRRHVFLQVLKELMSKLVHREKFSPNFSSSSFVIRVNLLPPCSL